MALMKPQTHVAKVAAEKRWQDDGNEAILAHRDDNLVWSANAEKLDAEDECITIERVKGDGSSFTAGERELLELETTQFDVTPTRTTNIKLTHTGAFHFSIGDTIRTVIVDERVAANIRIEVSEDGKFVPASVSVPPNTIVCWIWNGDDNEQQVCHLARDCCLQSADDLRANLVWCAN